MGLDVSVPHASWYSSSDVTIAVRCVGMHGAGAAKGSTVPLRKCPRCVAGSVDSIRSIASWPMLPTVTAGRRRVQEGGRGEDSGGVSIREGTWGVSFPGESISELAVLNMCFAFWKR